MKNYGFVRELNIAQDIDLHQAGGLQLVPAFQDILGTILKRNGLGLFHPGIYPLAVFFVEYRQRFFAARVNSLSILLSPFLLDRQEFPHSLQKVLVGPFLGLRFPGLTGPVNVL